VNDEEVAACVAAAIGQPVGEARVEPLGGKQGLLVCRVVVPGAGSYIFKVVRASGRRELALTASLSQAAPGTVPSVLACEEDTRRGLYWLVTQDVGPRRMADAPAIEGYMASAQALARIQMQTLEHTESFRQMGVPCVGPPQWEEIALRVLEAAGLSENPVLRAQQADLERAVWTTSDIARDTVTLPMALIHGDLHAGNIALADGAPVTVCLLDWGSAYLGAALLGLEELLWPAARYLRSQEDLNRVRAAYFREWTPVLGKPGRLERASAACRALVHLELLEEGLRRPAGLGIQDDFGFAAALRKYLEAWRAWERV
jgi:hypothetical protein